MIQPTTQSSDNQNQRKDIQQQVTDTIVKQLEEGTIPWQQSWVNKHSPLRLPKNAVTGKTYRGSNILLLWCAANEKQYTSHEWASFKQWQSKQESIRKGEKGSFIIFTDSFEKEVEGEIKKIPFLKYSLVFNKSQLVNYEAPKDILETEKPLAERIGVIDDFIGNTFAEIEHREGGACYVPSLDKLFMPPLNSFIDTNNCTASENYYSVLFHEMTHWTGHAKRLDRNHKGRYGDSDYAHEELIAEIGAAFLGAEFGITSPEKKDHANYIASWLKVLKNNKQFIITAARESSKAVSFMQEMQPLKFGI